MRLREKLGLRGFSVLSLGRLIPVKGLTHALEAVASVENAELIIAGAGPAREALEAQARRLKARSSAIWAKASRSSLSVKCFPSLKRSEKSSRMRWAVSTSAGSPSMETS